MLEYYRRANHAYCSFTPFKDREAWPLFRAAAIAEAVGWTALIVGIACKQLPVSWHEVPVAIAGRIHGMMLILYIMASLAFGSSLGWSIAKTFIAGLFSTPPYGSIVFEQWEARQRSHHRARQLYYSAQYHYLLDDRTTI
ncbi:MAG TPA: DUF3817 domain-containing protein [Candidatus Saccharimonadales bacterium]